jgi:hypothetical protein
MDFVGPFPRTHVTIEEFLKASWPQIMKDYDFQEVDFVASLAFTHILVVVDYFDRFVWAFPCTGDTQDEVIRCLRWLYSITGAAVGAYTDEGGHFAGEKTRTWLKEQGTIWVPSPVASKKATGLAEKCNDLLQRIMKKITEGVENWPLEVQPAAFELNKRFIQHLGHTAYEIRWGYQPASALERDFPTYSRQVMVNFLQSDDPFGQMDDDTMREAVFEFMIKRIDRARKINDRSEHVKDLQKERYDKGVVEYRHKIGSYVMLYDVKSAKKKLHPAYRGPFVVSGFAGDHSKSYKLRQINGAPIARSFSGDHLKPFKLRQGHLVTQDEEKLKLYQNIRAGRAQCKLPVEFRDALASKDSVAMNAAAVCIQEEILSFRDLELIWGC